MLAASQRPIGGRESLERADLLMEEIFLGLRSGGIDVHKLQQEYGINLFERYHRKLNRFLQEDLLTVNGRLVSLTNKGFLFCDGIALELSA
jgi:coproporphyrinogen III oxidase-like Fe-S oxidoreductase